MNNTAHLFLDPSGTVLLTDITVPSMLEFVPEASTDVVHTFRLRPWPGLLGGASGSSCFVTQMEDWYGLIQVELQGGTGKVLSADFLWGQRWTKASMA